MALKTFTVAAFAWLLFVLPLHAQPTNFAINTNVAPRAVPHAARYLFIVETSTSTRRMWPNIEQAAANIVVRDMSKQLHPGDTIGLWTYNSRLHLGEFPLQTWGQNSRSSIATNIVEFLDRQKLEKGNSLGSVISPLADLIQESEKLTVIILSAGGDPMVGSPYDEVINSTYERNRASLKKENLPFITLLRCWRGDIIAGSVNWPPWAMDFPKFPPEPKKIEPPKPPPPPEVHYGKPLIVIGTPPPPALAPPPEMPAASAEPVSNPPAAPAVAVANASGPEGANLASSTSPSAAESQGEILSVRPLAPSPPPVAPGQAPAASATLAPPVVPAPPPVAQTQPAPAPVPAEPSPQSVAANPGPATPAVQTGVLMPPSVIPLELLLIALCLLILAIVLGLYLMHRTRARHASLITSSMDRQKK